MIEWPDGAKSHVRNGGYVYARIKVQPAFGNGKRRAFPFHWYKRPLGFGDVYDYVTGKADWLAHGLADRRRHRRYSDRRPPGSG